VLYPTSDDLAYLLAREDAEIRKWFLVYQPPAETIRTFYWDTILHSKPQLEFLVQEFGAAHVILGSDYPYDMGTFECARQVKALSCGELDKVTMLNGIVQKLLAGVK